MKRVIYFVAIIATCGLGIMSCERNMENEPTLAEQQSAVTEGTVVLGAKIDDPYAIHNIKAAYSKLKSTGGDVPANEIVPNKKYIRFLPKDETEWDVLKRDSTLILYDFPLDYEIEVYGTYYHDPELPDSAITWQYCVIPVDKEIPNIKHELLYEVFIPDYDDIELDTSLKSESGANDFYEQLIYESYRLTGNMEKTEDNQNEMKGLFNPKRWNPSGRITVQDLVLGTVPLEGADVHARWSTHIETCVTNSDGRFSMSGFIYKVNYSIKWDRYQYSIRSGTIGQAWYNGPKQKGEWNLYITRGGASHLYATIHRAAYHYYYGNTGGIKRPPQNAFFNAQMKIAAMNEKNDEKNGRHCAQLRVAGIFNWIKIWNPQNRDDAIYGTTVHELAHASHWDMDHGKYNDSDSIVKESWARGVQWHLTRMVYTNYSVSYGSGKYTGVVEDMVDGFGGINNYDQVSGYTMSQLENAIKGQTTWNSWKNNIIIKYSNATEGNLQALFDHWN